MIATSQRATTWLELLKKIHLETTVSRKPKAFVTTTVERFTFYVNNGAL